MLGPEAPEKLHPVESQVAISLQAVLGLLPYSHSRPTVGHEPGLGGDAGQTPPASPPPELPLDDPLEPPLDDPLEPPLDDPLEPPLDDPLEPPLDDPLEPPLDDPLELPLDDPLELPELPPEPPELEPLSPSLPPSTADTNVAPPHAHIVARTPTAKSLERMEPTCLSPSHESNTGTRRDPRDCPATRARRHVPPRHARHRARGRAHQILRR